MTDGRSMAIGFSVLLGVALLPLVKFYAFQAARALWRGRDEPSRSEGREEDSGDDYEPSEEEAEELLIGQLVVETHQRHVANELESGRIDHNIDVSVRRRIAVTAALACDQLLGQDIDYGDQSFFQAWLDPYLQLSCAYWGLAYTRGLDYAQVEKMEAIARRLELEPGMRVLDIECGWGGLACYLAKHHGVVVTGISRQNSNIESARTWADKEGVSDRTQFMEGDSSGVHEVFDRVVCVSLREIYRAPSVADLDRLLRFTGKALVHQVTLDRVGQRTQVQPDAASPITEVTDITPDLFATVKSWHSNLIEEWSRGSLRAFDQQKRTWESTLTSLALASSDDVLVLEELVYTKTQAPSQHQAHDDTTFHQLAS